jgi:hypothetical protein
MFSRKLILTVNAQQARSNHLLASGFSPPGTGRTPLSSKLLGVNTALPPASKTSIKFATSGIALAAGHGL